MNPYRTFSDLLFTCVNGPKADVVKTVMDRFNRSNEESLRYSDGEPIEQYFVKKVDGLSSFPYVDKAERDTTKPNRIIFWEPRARPASTVLVGLFHDGLSYSVSRLSEHSPYTWINVRIYDDVDYPGCFFAFYSDYKRTLRSLMACRDENGWEFSQAGQVQPFENTGYYSKRLIKDRLNRDIVTEYLERLGYSISEENFWDTATAATLIWQARPAIRA